MDNINSFYRKMLRSYGPQGWWPLLDLHANNAGTNPTKTGSIKGYHPKDYSYPKTYQQKFEICIGSILAQSIGWTSVEKALLNLQSIKAVDPQVIQDMDISLLSELIRPAGYFNQKARKIKEFTQFFLSLNDRVPTRDELLSIWGIGPETADSILLYAYKVPVFVVDAYTRRIFKHDKREDYESIREIFESAMPRDYRLYQEYHALIVEHAKNSHSRKAGNKLRDMCNR